VCLVCVSVFSLTHENKLSSAASCLFVPAEGMSVCFVCVFAHVCVFFMCFLLFCLSLCVCVCVRERQRGVWYTCVCVCESERDRGVFGFCVCVCVCVCVGFFCSARG